MLPVGNIPQGWPGNHASQIKNKYSDPFLGNERDMPVCQQPVKSKIFYAFTICISYLLAFKIYGASGKRVEEQCKMAV
jgi:hypothetical protein